MDLPLSEACFIDANIIFYIHNIKKEDNFPDVIEKIYEKVIIHPEVISELSDLGKKFANEKIKSNKWILFDDSILSEIEKRMYLAKITDIEKKLKEVDLRRGKPESTGTGEIYSLAAATIMHAEYICSNDYSLKEVIEELPLKVYPNGNDELEPKFIKQHRFLDLCKIICETGLMERNKVFKNYKIALRIIKLDDPDHYKELIDQFSVAIPVPTT